MKNRFFALGVVLIVLCGCSQDDAGGEDSPYFKFSEDDLTKLIKPESLGTAIRYKNQLGDITEFNVSQCYIQPEAFGFASFWGASSTVDYKYDTQTTRVSGSVGGSSAYWNSNFSKSPQNRTGNYPYEYSNPMLTGTIEFSMYNANCADPYSLDCGQAPAMFGYGVQSLDIEGRHYENVKVYNSGVNTVVLTPYDGLHNRTVNRFYYLDAYGIIGYDEIDGTQWRRIN